MNSFFSSLDSVIKEFNSLDKKKTFRVISHLDSDGICACSILVKALINENINYSISIVSQLNEKKIKDFAKEDYEYFIFCDLGSGHIKEISTTLKDKRIFIFDHHITKDADFDNVTNVNPTKFGISGSTEVSSSGVVYIFAEKLNKKNEDMIPFALIGAIGDSQEQEGFKGLNQYILDKATKLGKIDVQKGLKLFGMQTKPLHKILQFSTNPFIPGITGNEKHALEFLKELGINPRVGNTWKKIYHLSEEEKEKLAQAIIKKRVNEKNPGNIYGQIYLLPNEDDESPTKDLREYSTVLNACGRLKKASLGIGACLGDEKMKTKAIYQLKKYKQEILNAMNWYQSNKKTSRIISGNGYVIMDSEEKIMASIIGTTCSIISKSGQYEKNTLILALGKEEEGNYKASLRVSGSDVHNDLNLKDIIQDICKNIEGCRWGGHKNASGTIIPKAKKHEFIKSAIQHLEKKGMEEFVE